eukprot:CAMPEP_0198314984 /NCGR_PEP_ID=MMETSP1450-20131203/5419_1 /TAXON_ID=753684 ORGANISM="Madagascaria erythrocladiodes, Strain CCMP3234" /NCGR_SAMPLE_ID=MMETSP1450 /ASSEMBLY_ACC=CAM_ASM_001115 /LENGTH=208 /DNA_ID=CAMNT_0044018069 /DNA_START=28 /DNA_END=650 /DNA_ORIENTATION=+
MTSSTDADGALQSAVEANNADEISRLLDSGFEINTVNAYGCTALHYAPNGNIVDLLLAAGADVHAQNSYGQTPIHYAIGNNKPSAILPLILAGADINYRPRGGYGGGKTPLEYSRMHEGNAHLVGVVQDAIDSRQAVLIALVTARRALLAFPSAPTLVVDNVIVLTDARCAKLTAAQRHTLVVQARARPVLARSLIDVLRAATLTPGA